MANVVPMLRAMSHAHYRQRLARAQARCEEIIAKRDRTIAKLRRQVDVLRIERRRALRLTHRTAARPRATAFVSSSTRRPEVTTARKGAWENIRLRYEQQAA